VSESTNPLDGEYKFVLGTVSIPIAWTKESKDQKVDTRLGTTQDANVHSSPDKVWSMAYIEGQVIVAVIDYARLSCSSSNIAQGQAVTPAACLCAI
jgi:hypothetical protein